MQFHVVSDSHEQMETAFECFKKATDENGYLHLVSTGNPTRDKVYFMNKFLTLPLHQIIQRGWMHLFHNHLLLQLMNCQVMVSIK
jgi:hypothetical protein